MAEEIKDERLSVIYHPAPGDPKTVEAYGETFKAGDPVKVESRFRGKIEGNPQFSIEGEKTFGDEQRDAQPQDPEDEDDGLTFDDNVLANRIEEYGTTDPEQALKYRQRGEQSFDGRAATRGKRRPPKDVLREEAKARAAEQQQDLDEVKQLQEDEHSAELERQSQVERQQDGQRQARTMPPPVQPID